MSLCLSLLDPQFLPWTKSEGVYRHIVVHGLNKEMLLQLLYQVEGYEDYEYEEDEYETEDYEHEDNEYEYVDNQGDMEHEDFIPHQQQTRTMLHFR